jgi:two-component system, NtrC family, sensor kinase
MRWLTVILHALPSAERRAQILLRANRLAPTMLSARSQIELYTLITRTLAELRLIGGIALLERSGTQLRFVDAGHERGLTSLPGLLQRHTAFDSAELIFAAGALPFVNVLIGRSAVLLDDVSELIVHQPADGVRAPLLPCHVGVRIPTILAPLLVGEQLRGVFVVCGPSLGADDIPVVEALTNQITAALEQLELRAQMEAHIGRLELIIDNMPDALLVIRPDQTVYPLNSTPLRASGYTSAELVGRDMFSLVPARYHDRLMHHWEAAHRGGIQRFEAEFLRRDGTTFTGSVTAGRIPGSDDLLAIVTDITARRRLFQSEKMAALGRLVAGVAHELNNPLAVILGLTQLNLQEGPSEQLDRDLRGIEMATLRASSILQQMTTFVRPQDAKPSPIHLGRMLEELCEQLRLQTSTQQIELQLDLAETLGYIMGDSVQIRQVLLNIVSNAMQALERVEADQPRRISMRGWATIDRARVAIADTGVGISPEYLQRIFEPFFTTHSVGQGVGLGLAISYTIVQQHGGNLWAESIADGGSVFHISLPVAQQAALARG